MKNTSVSHVPFALLPTEARVLFSIYASAALARFRSQIPTSGNLAAGLERIWNASKLTLVDLSDPYGTTAILEAQIAALIGCDKKKKTADFCNRRWRTKRGE